MGWASFEKNFPRDALIMKQCLVDMSEQLPGSASMVEYS